MGKIIYKEDNLRTPEIRKPTKSQTFIRVIAMIFKVLAMIGFVLSILGFIGCIVSSCWIVTNSETIVNGKTIAYWAWKYNTTVYTISYSSLVMALVMVGSGAISWLCWLYFGHMFRNKTPFTFKTFREGIRIAIICGGIVIVGAILSAIIFGIYKANYGSKVAWTGFGFWPFLGSGIVFLIISFIFRHGAEVREMLVEARKPKK